MVVSVAWRPALRFMNRTDLVRLTIAVLMLLRWICHWLLWSRRFRRRRSTANATNAEHMNKIADLMKIYLEKPLSTSQPPAHIRALDYHGSSHSTSLISRTT